MTKLNRELQLTHANLWEKEVEQEKAILGYRRQVEVLSAELLFDKDSWNKYMDQEKLITQLIDACYDLCAELIQQGKEYADIKARHLWKVKEHEKLAGNNQRYINAIKRLVNKVNGKE